MRDFVRSKIGGESGIREKQRLVVSEVGAASPESGWQAQDDALGKYVQLSLLQHMREGVFAAKQHDTEAHAWLEQSDDVLDSHYVKCAANCLGVEVLLTLADQHEAKGELWHSVKRLVNAAYTKNFTQLGSDAGNTPLLKRAMDILVRVPQTIETRTLEVVLRMRLCLILGLCAVWRRFVAY